MNKLNRENQSLLADGHSPATYYVIADNIREE